MLQNVSHKITNILETSNIFELLKHDVYIKSSNDPECS